ncbi:ORF3 [Broome densovirus 1]|uniref:ORF3 n=1 Tax=Broome densovirus TaxID=3070203 RepID=A0A7D6C7J6_9VIRU|nr:ORF3 [Broome densovirus 1]QLJ83484.1 ORF3 [Broome densovirus 1]
MAPTLLFPGHKYLGPGNQSQLKGNTAEPIDKDDEIAAAHDNAYELAKTKEDVYSADWTAIKDFGSDFLKSGNYHSAIGAVGLGVKTAAERLTNSVFYPPVGKLCPNTKWRGPYKKVPNENQHGFTNIINLQLGTSKKLDLPSSNEETLSRQSAPELTIPNPRNRSRSRNRHPTVVHPNNPKCHSTPKKTKKWQVQILILSLQVDLVLLVLVVLDLLVQEATKEQAPVSGAQCNGQHSQSWAPQLIWNTIISHIYSELAAKTSLIKMLLMKMISTLLCLFPFMNFR